MTLHLRKLCVGVESPEQLRAFQAARLRSGERLGHRTRSWPKRSAEILDGGALYWIISGQISCRQAILGFEREAHEIAGERPYCRIILAPALVFTAPRPHRPFQGWRYLKPEEAPPDLAGIGDDDSLPALLVAELKALGAW